MNKLISLLIFLLLTSFKPIYSSEQQLSIETIATGLGIPWGMAIMPNNTMLITQREGTVSQLDLSTGRISTISGFPINSIKVGGQGGLFDIALTPNYPNEKWIYISYNKNVGGQGATTLARAKLENQILVNWQDLLITKSISNTKVHYGGRITFDDHGHVFLSVGERGVRPNAQNLSNHAGKILRLNLDGSTPKDNPFTNNDKILPEIWSYGHRNPQGLFFNIVTQQLWSVEHGPRGGDEINLIKAGKNYGWPIISYGMEYNSPAPVGESTEKEGMEQPVKTYIPSIATSSLIQYKGSALPDWQGDLLIGALKSEHLNQVKLNQNNEAVAESRLLRSINGRIRNVIESPEGYLYLSTDDGRILKIQADNKNFN
ncbi:MAG: PQQ-dependent sugar dehydrogenase [Methylophaga sp.]|nr:PQQ-dependent sugar dehydrogenase [Methylophaga sp.]